MAYIKPGSKNKSVVPIKKTTTHKNTKSTNKKVVKKTTVKKTTPIPPVVPPIIAPAKTPTPAPTPIPSTVVSTPITAFLTVNPAANQIATTVSGLQSITTDLALPFNPNDLTFNYNLNKISFDTYGGRVTQLLSVKTDTMQIQADAGSRSNLMALYNSIKTLQMYQIETRTGLDFTIPSNGSHLSQTMLGNGGLKFCVWIRSMDIGWDATTVTYPYSLTFEVQDNYESAGYNGYGVINSFIGDVADLFAVTASGIGYNAFYAGMGTNNANNLTTNAANQLAFEGTSYTALQNDATGFGTNFPILSNG